MGVERDPEARDRVKARALRLLARREHGVRELGEKLLRKPGTDPEDVREVVQELADRELVSDRRYAEAFARDEVDDDALARRLAEAYLPRLAGLGDDARWRRLAGYLQRRGFDNERIYHVCAALLPEVDAAAE